MDGFKESKVDCFGGLTVLCGPNGAGKSRLLTATIDALAGRPGLVDVDVRGEVTAVAALDPLSLINLQRVSFGGDANLEDRLDQVEPTPMKKDELRLFSYLMGREYASVTVLEVDNDATAEQVGYLRTFDAQAQDLTREFLPYYSVEHGGARYEFGDLSHGEIAALNLLWTLQRSAFSSVLVVEEPETLLAPQAQQRAFDVIARYAGDRKFSVLVSTHSFLGVSSTPVEHTKIISGLPGAAQLSQAGRAEIWQTLRVRTPKCIVLLVEDVAASQWLERLMRVCDYEFLDEVVVQIAGDATSVRYGSSVEPRTEHRILTFGVLDGDERGKKGSTHRRLFFLPSAVSIEELVIAFLTRNLHDEISEPTPLPQLAKALTATDGDEIHDRVANLAARLGLPVSTLRHLATEWWISTETGCDLLAQFREFLSSIRPPEGS